MDTWSCKWFLDCLVWCFIPNHCLCSVYGSFTQGFEIWLFSHTWHLRAYWASCLGVGDGSLRTISTCHGHIFWIHKSSPWPQAANRIQKTLQRSTAQYDGAFFWSRTSYPCSMTSTLAMGTWIQQSSPQGPNFLRHVISPIKNLQNGDHVPFCWIELLANVAERSSAGCLGHQGRIQKATAKEDVSWNTSKTMQWVITWHLGTSGIGLLRFVFAFLNLCCPKGMFLQLMFAGCRRQRRISLGHHFRKLSTSSSPMCVSWNRCCSFLPLKAKVRIELQGPMIFGRLYPSAFLAESQHATPGTLEKGVNKQTPGKLTKQTSEMTKEQAHWETK